MEFLLEFLGQFLTELREELMVPMLPKERGSKKLRIMAGVLDTARILAGVFLSRVQMIAGIIPRNKRHRRKQSCTDSRAETEEPREEGSSVSVGTKSGIKTERYGAAIATCHFSLRT